MSGDSDLFAKKAFSFTSTTLLPQETQNRILLGEDPGRNNSGSTIRQHSDIVISVGIFLSFL